MAHRIDKHQPGSRDLSICRSATLAAEAMGLTMDKVDAVELHAPYSSQELVLARALNLGERAEVSPSGGALAAQTPMVTGLIRIGEAANLIRRGGARSTVGHATSGPCLQHNLLCWLEAR